MQMIAVLFMSWLFLSIFRVLSSFLHFPILYFTHQAGACAGQVHRSRPALPPADHRGAHQDHPAAAREPSAHPGLAGEQDRIGKKTQIQRPGSVWLYTDTQNQRN